MNFSALTVLTVILSAVVAKKGHSALSQLDVRDIDRYLNDSEFVYRQLQCVLARGRCDKTGNQLKFAIPEVLMHNCRACSPEQAKNAHRLIDFVQTNYPQEFRQIKAKYTRRPDNYGGRG